jgi:hypothetical protein
MVSSRAVGSFGADCGRVHRGLATRTAQGLIVEELPRSLLAQARIGAFCDRTPQLFAILGSENLEAAPLPALRLCDRRTRITTLVGLVEKFAGSAVLRLFSGLAAPEQRRGYEQQHHRTGQLATRQKNEAHLLAKNLSSMHLGLRSAK